MCKFIYFEKQVNTFLTRKFQLALILQSLPDSSSGSKILQLTCSIMWEKQFLNIVQINEERSYYEDYKLTMLSTHINHLYPNSS